MSKIDPKGLDAAITAYSKVRVDRYDTLNASHAEGLEAAIGAYMSEGKWLRAKAIEVAREGFTLEAERYSEAADRLERYEAALREISRGGNGTDVIIARKALGEE